MTPSRHHKVVVTKSSARDSVDTLLGLRCEAVRRSHDIGRASFSFVEGCYRLYVLQIICGWCVGSNPQPPRGFTLRAANVDACLCNASACFPPR